MKRDDRPSCVFKNDKVNFRSYINEFTNDLYKAFDLSAKKIGLDSKIDDLFDGKLVNFTEDLAAWHPKYRAQYNPKKSDTFSHKMQQMNSLVFMIYVLEQKNIVTIGIGGSYEGPKMFLEIMDLTNTVTNFLFITGSDLSEFR